MAFAILDDPKKTVFSVSTNIDLSIAMGKTSPDNVLHIQIEQFEITSMKIVVNIKDVDIAKLKMNFNFLFNTIRYAINKYYLDKGVPIDFIEGLKLKEVNVGIVDSTYLKLNVIPDFNSTNFTWIQPFN